jgi:hypothetical protein
MSNGIKTKHPLYTDAFPLWELMIDAHKGEAAVKGKTTTYLPATESMTQDGLNAGQIGKRNYDAYLLRSFFPDLVRDSVNSMTGVITRKPITITVPTAMEEMLENTTALGEDIFTLYRRILEHIFVTGRFGLLLDVQTGTNGSALPYIATYSAPTIINWDDGQVEDGQRKFQMIVLDESEHVRSNIFDWNFVEKFRLLFLDETGNYSVVMVSGSPGDAGAPSLNREVIGPQVVVDHITEQDVIIPAIRGNSLERIPFVFIGTNDLAPEPPLPPLLGLGRLSMLIYRGEADYRQTLFMQGQETLVISGVQPALEGEVGAERRLGVGSVIELTEPTAKAEFVGVSADGLSEQRTALENDYRRAERIGGRLADTKGANVESGEALQIRTSAQTATLASIARTSAAGLQAVLRIAAEWTGHNPEEVTVEPNLDFVDDPMTGEELVKLMAARTAGAPISLRTIHRLMTERDLTEMEFEAELDERDLEDEERAARMEALMPAEEEGDEDDDGDDLEENV